MGAPEGGRQQHGLGGHCAAHLVVLAVHGEVQHDKVSAVAGRLHVEH